MKASISMDKKTGELLLGFLPAMAAIFTLGFIPKHDEIVEFDEDMYKAYKQKTGESTKPLYTVILNDPNYVPEEVDGVSVAHVLTADNVNSLRKGIDFFDKYAKDNQLTSADSSEILEHAAKIFPNALLIGTKYERTQSSGSDDGTSREQWADFLANTVNHKDVLNIRYTDKDGLVHDSVFAPAVEHKVENNKMSYDEFKQYAIESLSKIWRDEKYKVVENVSRRRDDEAYEVIHVKEKVGEVEVNKGFIVRPFYNDYLLGKPLGEIVLEMVHQIERGGEAFKGIGFDLEKMTDFDAVKDRLIIKPINYNRNRKLLKDCLYRKTGDIAVVIYILIKHDSDIMYSAKVNKKIIDEWNIPGSDIFDLAAENTERLYPALTIPLEAILAGADKNNYPDVNKFFMRPDCEIEESPTGTYALLLYKNKSSSAAVFYRGTLSRLTELLNDDIYLVIASDYIMLHTATSGVPVKRLKHVAKKNNAEDPELLSDKVYYFSRQDRVLKVVP